MTLYEASNLANDLINEFKQKGLIGPEWRFTFIRSRKTLGKCHYIKKTISLSKFYVSVATEEQIKDTVLHEISHSICGRGNGHNAKWKKVCVELGCRPERCASYKELENIPAKYIGVCPTCGSTFRAYRKLKSMNKRFCSKRACKARGEHVIWKEGAKPNG